MHGIRSFSQSINELAIQWYIGSRLPSSVFFLHPFVHFSFACFVVVPYRAPGSNGFLISLFNPLQLGGSFIRGMFVPVVRCAAPLCRYPWNCTLLSF
jgi:hypothetical protein